MYFDGSKSSLQRNICKILISPKFGSRLEFEVKPSMVILTVATNQSVDQSERDLVS